MRTRMLALVVLAAIARSGAAASPDVDTLVARMKAALEPPKSSVRQLKLSISGEDGGTTQWILAQARKTVDGRGRILTVLLAPSAERGVESLLIDGDKTVAPVSAVYIPAVRRVRTLTPQGAYEPFLGSDFFYADLGFLSLRDKYRLVGSEKHAGKEAFEIEQTPESPWYYSRIVAWIDPATMLPLERDYYDPAGQLWKVETFEDVTTFDGQPVATRVTMQDKPGGGSSVIAVSKLRFGVDLPDALFERAALRTAGASPVWAGLE
jgi:hypothetical protein